MDLDFLAGYVHGAQEYEQELADKLERERYGPAFQAHSETSREAAVAIREHTASYRERIYKVIEAAESGICDEMISTITGIDQNTVRPRRVELMRDGRIKAAPYTTKTTSGRRANAWVIAE